jgi:hypothetical protein
MADARRAADEIGVAIIGGHTGYQRGLSSLALPRPSNSTHCACSPQALWLPLFLPNAWET